MDLGICFHREEPAATVVGRARQAEALGFDEFWVIEDCFYTTGVTLGAALIEKHFTLRRSEGGVDSSFSLEPDELAALVTETKRAWEALGNVQYGPTEAELKSMVFRRSIYVAENIKSGETFTAKNLRIVRPGHGAPPYLLDSLLGKIARKDYSVGSALSLDQLLE